MNNRCNTNQTIMRYFNFSFLSIFLFLCTTLWSQSSENTSQTIDRLNELSAQEKILLKERKEVIKALQLRFKATLSDTQKALLKNDSLPRKKRRAMFIKTLTSEQKTIYEAIHRDVNRYRGYFLKRRKGRHKKRGKHPSKSHPRL